MLQTIRLAQRDIKPGYANLLQAMTTLYAQKHTKSESTFMKLRNVSIFEHDNTWHKFSTFSC